MYIKALDAIKIELRLYSCFLATYSDLVDSQRRRITRPSAGKNSKNNYLIVMCHANKKNVYLHSLFSWKYCNDAQLACNFRKLIIVFFFFLILDYKCVENYWRVTTTLMLSVRARRRGYNSICAFKSLLFLSYTIFNYTLNWYFADRSYILLKYII